MSIFLEIIKLIVSQVFVNPIPFGLRRITVNSILGWAAPWARSATSALHDLQSIDLGYHESTFYEDWAEVAPKFKGKEKQVEFDQRFAYYYTIYLRDAAGNKYQYTTFHLSDEPLTREELRVEIGEQWEKEVQRSPPAENISAAHPYMVRLRSATVRTGDKGTRPL